MIIAELSVVPLGTKTPSVSKYVAGAVKELEAMGLKPRLTAMGTEFEAENIEKVLKAAGRAHESVFKAGGERVVTVLKIDERRDKEGSMGQKVSSVKEKVEE